MPKIKAIMNEMITKTITETTAIANAFSHPQSKKCFINASQTTNIIIADIKLPAKAPTTAPIIVPRTTIQMASVNFALSLPANALPTSQSIGAITIIPTTICISIGKVCLHLLSLRSPIICNKIHVLYALLTNNR